MALENFKPDAFSVEVLKTLEEIGFSSATLKGGALRDIFLGLDDKINDYDIWADFGSVVDPVKTGHGFHAILKDHIQGVFPNAVLKPDGSTGEDFSETTGFAGAKIEFSVNGKDIDLYVCNVKRSLQETAMQGDAPLNSIAMNSKGDVYAHPDFEDHCTKKLYNPMVDLPADYIAARFNRLSSKIQGLRQEDEIAPINALSPAIQPPRPPV